MIMTLDKVRGSLQSLGHIIWAPWESVSNFVAAHAMLRHFSKTKNTRPPPSGTREKVSESPKSI